MISMRGLQFAYPGGEFLLQIPELQLSDSSIVFSGPSGSGKTTLLHLIAGILSGSRGEINVAGRSLHQMTDSERRLFRLRHVGLVFQDFQLLEYLNVLDNVLLPCRIHSSVSLNSTLRERASQLLESVGLAEKYRRPVPQLSQGERQRVAICRALLLNPKVVLADEPTGNLDPENAERIVQLLIRETSQADSQLIMVTHDHSLLKHFHRVVSFDQFRQRVGVEKDCDATTKTTGAAR